MYKGIKIEIEGILRDQYGRVLHRYPRQLANSLVVGLCKILTSEFAQLGQSVTDTGGTARTLANAYSANCAAGTAKEYGIVIGTGTNTVTIDDNKLQTPVQTNITFGAMAITGENPDANTWRTKLSRSFTNLTGAQLDITEVGLYTYGATTPWYLCIERTLYSASVAHTAAITLTYYITVTL